MSAAEAAQPTAQLMEAAKVRELDPVKVRFSRHGAWIRCELTDEISHRNVAIVRVFPLSDPDSFLSVRDSTNAEVGLIVDVNALSNDCRRCVIDELHRRYLCPIIRRIVQVKERFGTVDWTVDTDRGGRTFTTRDLRENVTRLPNGRYLLNDIENNRYDVPNAASLDAISRAFLQRYL